MNQGCDFLGFDPEFDDTTWTEEWLYVPVAQVPPGTHPSGYRIEQRFLEAAEVFGLPYKLAMPFDCRLLFDPDGEMWMSSTPQEHIMMVNNARRSRGNVLVGGLGLGLYPQYATRGVIGAAEQFTIVERSQVVCDIVVPLIETTLDVPVTIRRGEIEAFLSGDVETKFDTVFLDTWPDLDPLFLPAINSLRDHAVKHLAPDGEILLWGYQWMVSLFLAACKQVLGVPAKKRDSWLVQDARSTPEARDLLAPVLARFADVNLVESDMSVALAFCRNYIMRVRAE